MQPLPSVKHYKIVKETPAENHETEGGGGAHAISKGIRGRVEQEHWWSRLWASCHGGYRRRGLVGDASGDDE